MLILATFTTLPLAGSTEAPSGFLVASLTVAGEIQTDDPWTTGDVSHNEWAKPMYYIWLDDNGNPDDGPYGNGQGPVSTIVNLDTGRVGLKYIGEDGVWSTGDDVQYWPIYETSTGSKTWINESGIEASIHGGGSTFTIAFPLDIINNPDSLDIGFMASPWTSSALDNSPTWISIADARTSGAYHLTDPQGDTNAWPDLTPDNTSNFDILMVDIEIIMEFEEWNLQLDQTQFLGYSGEHVVVTGTLFNQTGFPLGSKILNVYDGVHGIETTVTTDSQGRFSYDTIPWEAGDYQITFLHGTTVIGYVDLIIRDEVYVLNLEPTDVWIDMGETFVVDGILLDPWENPVPGERIEIYDMMANVHDMRDTDGSGRFTYSNTPLQMGSYMLSFEHDSGIRNTVLVDVGNTAIISLFKELSIRNVDNVPVIVVVTYEGPMTQEQAESGESEIVPIVVEDEFGSDLRVIESGYELTYAEVTDFQPSLVDTTLPEPWQWEDDPQSGDSVALESCPVQIGVGEVCIDSTGTASVNAGQGIQGGVWFNTEDFGITLGVGGNIPYILKGGGAISFGTNGIFLVGSAGPSLAHGTYSIEVIGVGEDEESMKYVVESPVEVFLTDPLGRSIGVDPETRQWVNEIPGATYTGAASDKQIIYIPADSLVDGNYSFDLLGTGDGEYHVYAETREGQMIDGNATKVILHSEEYTSTIQDGGTVKMSLDVNSDTGSFDLTVVSTSGGDEFPSWIWIVVALIVVAAAVGVAYFYMGRKRA